MGYEWKREVPETPRLVEIAFCAVVVVIVGLVTGLALSLPSIAVILLSLVFLTWTMPILAPTTVSDGGDVLLRHPCAHSS